MAVLMMVGLLLMTAGFYLFVLPPATRQAKDTPSAEAAAAALLVHQKAAVDWCLRTSCPDGVVPAAGLTLPPGYGTASWIHSVALGGRVSTYATGLHVSSLAIAAGLGDLTSGGPSAGLSTAEGTIAARDLVSPGRLAVVIGTDIPAGLPVVSQKVK